jgi:hypothetical protein
MYGDDEMFSAKALLARFMGGKTIARDVIFIIPYFQASEYVEDSSGKNRDILDLDQLHRSSLVDKI